jgi:hypothetical protein
MGDDHIVPAPRFHIPYTYNMVHLYGPVKSQKWLWIKRKTKGRQIAGIFPQGLLKPCAAWLFIFYTLPA